MSLNGTLETFALPDVLALLAATKKTGELQVNGGRGEARVWLDKGEMVAAAVPRAITFVDAVFEMLRLTSGKFAFDNDSEAVDPGEPMALEPLLLEAQSRLGEWRSIEAVVPSTACSVSLMPTVTGPKVSLTAEQWRALVAVAASPDVESVTEKLGLGEFAGCRMVKDLVQIGLVAIGEAPAPVAAQHATKDAAAEPTAAPAAKTDAESAVPATAAPAPAPAAARQAPPRPVNPAAAAAAASTAPPAASPRGFKPAARPRVAAGLGADPAPSPIPAAKGPARAEVRQPALRADPPAEIDLDEEAAEDPAELVHQLAHLQDEPTPTPPAKATAPDVSPEDADKGEEPLNRGLLLKFLNSVRS